MKPSERIADIARAINDEGVEREGKRSLSAWDTWLTVQALVEYLDEQADAQAESTQNPSGSAPWLEVSRNEWQDTRRRQPRRERH